ncbi:hypothetical protein LTS18_006766, partial [Coniosporium uncinatum]
PSQQQPRSTQQQVQSVQHQVQLLQHQAQPLQQQAEQVEQAQQQIEHIQRPSDPAQQPLAQVQQQAEHARPQAGQAHTCVPDRVQGQESWPSFSPTEWMPHGDAEMIIDFNADTQLPSFMQPDQPFEEVLTNEAEHRHSLSLSGDTPNSSVKNLANDVKDLQAQV